MQAGSANHSFACVDGRITGILPLQWRLWYDTPGLPLSIQRHLFKVT